MPKIIPLPWRQAVFTDPQFPGDLRLGFAAVNRLCTKFESEVSAPFPRDSVLKFANSVQPIANIRDTNEHGLEPNAWSRFNLRDQTITLLGLGKCSFAYDERWYRRVHGVPYLGSLDLRPIYQATKEFESVAGF